jgi:hypothetical protein
MTITIEKARSEAKFIGGAGKGQAVLSNQRNNSG